MMNAKKRVRADLKTVLISEISFDIIFTPLADILINSIIYSKIVIFSNFMR
jgi:hypothetical protein